jgi:hypothetical protein
LLIFPAILSMDLYRREDRRLDIFCCFTRYIFRPLLVGYRLCGLSRVWTGVMGAGGREDTGQRCLPPGHSHNPEIVRHTVLFFFFSITAQS